MTLQIGGLVDPFVFLLQLLRLEDLTLLWKPSIDIVEIRLTNVDLQILHPRIYLVEIVGNVERNGEILQYAIHMILLCWLFVHNHIIDV